MSIPAAGVISLVVLKQNEVAAMDAFVGDRCGAALLSIVTSRDFRWSWQVLLSSTATSTAGSNTTTSLLTGFEEELSTDQMAPVREGTGQ
jgi:hypothetical protein